jgi:hypothetical protein
MMARATRSGAHTRKVEAALKRLGQGSKQKVESAQGLPDYGGAQMANFLADVQLSRKSWRAFREGFIIWDPSQERSSAPLGNTSNTRDSILSIWSVESLEQNASRNFHSGAVIALI